MDGVGFKPTPIITQDPNAVVDEEPKDKKVDVSSKFTVSSGGNEFTPSGENKMEMKTSFSQDNFTVTGTVSANHSPVSGGDAFLNNKNVGIGVSHENQNGGFLKSISANIGLHENQAFKDEGTNLSAGLKFKTNNGMSFSPGMTTNLNTGQTQVSLGYSTTIANLGVGKLSGGFYAATKFGDTDGESYNKLFIDPKLTYSRPIGKGNMSLMVKGDFGTNIKAEGNSWGTMVTSASYSRTVVDNDKCSLSFNTSLGVTAKGLLPGQDANSFCNGKLGLVFTIK